jgi:hypothetical protein
MRFAMTLDEVDKTFEVDENGAFIRLVLPNDKLGKEINLIGKKGIDLPIDLKVRVKQYANKLYAEASE